MTVNLDSGKIQSILNSAGSNPTVLIPVTGDSDEVISMLDGQMVKYMESKKAILEIQTDKAAYTLPASEINIDAISQELGKDVNLSDIKVEVKIAEPSDQSVKIVESAAKDGSFSIMVQPVEFEVNCTYEGKTIEVSKYNAYVKRSILIPDGVDPYKITTAVVTDAGGSVRHIPTNVEKINGKYYAIVNSLTNSVYTLIYNEKTFSDITGKWYEDVPKNAWYAGAVGTAYEYGIVTGSNGEFMPNSRITRQDAMLMLQRAAEITGYTGTTDKAALDFTDLGSASNYAKDAMYWNLYNGFIQGSNEKVRPKSEITRGECATVLLRLLQKSNLIDIRTEI